MSAALPAVDTKQVAIREARKRLQQRIRNDWSFTCEPTCPALSGVAADSSAIQADAILSTEDGNDDNDSEDNDQDDDYSAIDDTLVADDRPYTLPHFSEWRERTYASSDPSSDEDADLASARSKPDLLLRRKRDILFGSSASDLYPSSSSTHRDSTSDPRSSPTPPTQEDVARRRRAARSHRRRRKLEDEMAWNEGLRFWQARRDNWCCAKTVPRNHSAASVEQLDDAHGQHEDSGHGSAETQSSEEGSTGGASLELKRYIEAGTTLIPIAPPLIPPGDPTHINITPSLYPSIYSKIVMQSLTPSVPINLSHILAALVDGWKRDGEWPPKSELTAPPSVAQSMSSARASAATAAGAEANGSRLGGLAGHFGVRKGMARMKRSLRLSLSGGSGTGTGTGDDRAGPG